MDAKEFWSLGDYGIVGDLWGSPGRDLASSLDVAGKEAIDLGTGTGVTAIALAERGAASVTGVDITPPLLEEAARRAGASGVEVRWVEADLSEVPLPSASADLVTSTFGLIFATDPARAIAEACRLVRPGGAVVFTSWSRDGLFGRLRTVMAGYFPEEPAPWHESAEGIRTVAGRSVQVVERTFELIVDSPGAFVESVERFSAPFLVAAGVLGDRWPQARAELLAEVARAGRPTEDGFAVDVAYLVATLDV